MYPIILHTSTMPQDTTPTWWLEKETVALILIPQQS